MFEVMRPHNRKTIRQISNRSVPMPIRKAKEGERVAIHIRNVPYTVCDESEKEMTCSISREQLKVAGF